MAEPYQTPETLARQALENSPAGQAALQAYVDARAQGIDAFVFAQDVRRHIGEHSDYLMRCALRKWEAGSAPISCQVLPRGLSAFLASFPLTCSAHTQDHLAGKPSKRVKAG